MELFVSNHGADLTWRERLAALRVLPRFIRLVYDCHPLFANLIVLLRLLRGVLPAALLWVGKLIIETVEFHYRAGSPIPWDRLGALIALELALALSGDALARASSLVDSLLGDLFSNKISIRLMRHASELDLAEFEDPETYDRLARARDRATGPVGPFLQLLDIAQAVVALMSLLVPLGLFVPWLLVLLAVAVVPSFFGETHFASHRYFLLRQWTGERRRLDYLRFVAASDRTVKEVKLFHLLPYLVDRYSSVAWQFYHAKRRLVTRQAIVSTILAAIGTVGYYSAYAIIIYLTAISYRSPGGVFTIGVLAFLAASFRQSRDLIERILLALSRVYEQSLYIRDLLQFFEMKPHVVSIPGAARIPRPIQDGFVFDGVGFRYPGSGEWAVRNLSFRIQAHQAVALVGENGAGKTTIVKLLARLYDPDEGRILLDGTDLRAYELKDLWSTIAVIFQDFVRYSWLFKENIGVGEVTRIQDDNRIREAARCGLAMGIADRLKHGFNQQLGREFEAGVELSGGEWQRMALSRAYMRDAQVLILDEPTASLDARAEHEVFRRVTELARQRIALIISHRFSTVRVADRILVLERGRLVEHGAHDELVARDGVYAELFTLQAGGYR